MNEHDEPDKKNYSYSQSLRDLLIFSDQQFWLRNIDHDDIAVDSYLRDNAAQTPMLSEESIRARSLLAETVSEIGGIPTEVILGNLSACPAIFTGPHCSLLVSIPTFISNCLALRLARIRENTTAIVYACSTVSLQSKNGVGPGWVEFKGMRHNIFNVGRKIRDTTVVCAANGSWSFESLQSSGHSEVRSIGEQLSGICGSSPEEAILRANNALIGGNSVGKEGVRLATITDNHVGRLIGKHLAVDGLISDILLDKLVRRRLLDAIETAGREFRSIFPGSTDLFWVIDGGKRFSGKIIGDQITVPGSPKKLAFCLTREELIRSLNERTIVPNLFLVFVVLCILPSCICFGGHRQMVYVKIFKEILKNTIPHRSQRLFGSHPSGRSVWLPDGLGTTSHPLSLVAHALASNERTLNAASVVDYFPKNVLLRTRLDFFDPAWYSAVTALS
ncbi:hypothetical protein LJR245_007437 [Rhizobium leguminosarum]|uniref:hypothetical protein n=1 Tax=Rhizobium leguminosarum TaxID=384 RepID=UPI003ED0BD57